MQKCEQCGKDFYSDTEFREHQQFEAFLAMGEKNRNLFGNIEFGINMLIIMQIMQQLKLSFTEATECLWGWREILNQSIGRHNKEQAAK